VLLRTRAIRGRDPDDLAVVLHAVVEAAETFLIANFVAAAQGMGDVMGVLQPETVFAALDGADVVVVFHQGAPDLGRHVARIACPSW